MHRCFPVYTFSCMQAPRRRGGTFLLLVEDPAPVGTSAAASEYLSMLSCFVPPRSPPISLCPSSPHAQGLSTAEKRWRNRAAKERAKAGGGSYSLLFSSYSLAFNMHACEAAKSRARADPGHTKFGSAAVASSISMTEAAYNKHTAFML